MNHAIDAALEPHEYLSDEAAACSSRTMTIEVEEHRKLMDIAGAVYAHLHQGASVEVLRKACNDYSEFCGVIPKSEIEAIERMRRQKKTGVIVSALVELNKAMQQNEPPRQIRKLCERLISDYADARWKRK
ncbi:hypothetical protein LJC59_00825 [Desulfovibrio sp. OttesenSCG-928-A18]|nr:hypothetical protein [Desulfovibrio sp. OttesenSCG-928-A18]